MYCIYICIDVLYLCNRLCYIEEKCIFPTILDVIYENECIQFVY